MLGIPRVIKTDMYRPMYRQAHVQVQGVPELPATMGNRAQNWHPLFPDRPSRGREDPPEPKKGSSSTATGDEGRIPSSTVVQSTVYHQFLKLHIRKLKSTYYQAFRRKYSDQPESSSTSLSKKPRNLGEGGTLQNDNLGKGYACVFTPSGLKWVPSKWVKPYIPKIPKSKTTVQVASTCWRRKKCYTL